MKHSLPTRLLHFLMFVTLIFQLVGALFMLIPEPYGATGDFGYRLHENVGLASLAIIGGFWLWMFVRRARGTAVGALIPWFSRVRIKAVIADLWVYFKALKAGELPSTQTESPFASAVHGLGLLTATALAATGGALYVLMGANGSLSFAGELVLSLHSDFGNLMWTYLFAHAGLALLHQLKGHGTLQKIF